jgi:hypothetical protein
MLFPVRVLIRGCSRCCWCLLLGLIGRLCVTLSASTAMVGWMQQLQVSSDVCSMNPQSLNAYTCLCPYASLAVKLARDILQRDV